MIKKSRPENEVKSNGAYNDKKEEPEKYYEETKVHDGSFLSEQASYEAYKDNDVGPLAATQMKQLRSNSVHGTILSIGEPYGMVDQLSSSP